MASFRVGAAALPITPLAQHLRRRLYLGGYNGYRGRPAQGIHDDLYARSIVISDGTTAVALVALDLVGITNVHIAALRRGAALRLNLPEAHILVACTHTHHSPDLQGLWGGVSREYARYLRRQALRSLIQAADVIRDASLHIASVQLKGHAINRRGWELVDPTLAVVQARDSGGGVIATVANLAVHPVVAGEDNLLVSRDFPGALVDRLEEASGGVALYINGDEGDANPAARGDLRTMEAYGQGLAQDVLKALKDVEPLTGPIALRSRHVDIPVANARIRLPSGLALAAFMAFVRGSGRLGVLHWLADRFPRDPRAFVFAALAMSSQHPLFIRRDQAYLRTRASYLRIGQGVEAIAAPGEVLTRLGLSLRSRLSAPVTLFLGLTNDSLGYFVPLDEWLSGRNRSYEESMSLGPAAAPTLADAIISLLPAS